MIENSDGNSNLLLSLEEALSSHKGSKWPLAEGEVFMERRCGIAIDDVEAKLKKEALVGRSGFVAVLPLYDFDFNRRVSFFSRPAATEIESVAYHQFISQLADRGLEFFVDRPNRAPDLDLAEGGIEFQNRLGDFKMGEMARNYVLESSHFEEYSVEFLDYYRRVFPSFFSWTLYVLLPGMNTPRPSLSNELHTLFVSWLDTTFE